MKFFCILLLAITTCSCEKQHDEKFYLGELHFSALRFGSFYNLEDSLKLKFIQAMDTLRLEKTDSAQRVLYEAYLNLKFNGMLYKPFVDLRLNDSTFLKLYLDSADYDRIKIYKWRNLLNEKKKVTLWGRTKKIGSYGFPLLYCTELIDIKISDGQTFPGKQGKLLIEDYN